MEVRSTWCLRRDRRGLGSMSEAGGRRSTRARPTRGDRRGGADDHARPGVRDSRDRRHRPALAVAGRQRSDDRVQVLTGWPDCSSGCAPRARPRARWTRPARCGSYTPSRTGPAARPRADRDPPLRGGLTADRTPHARAPPRPDRAIPRAASARAGGPARPARRRGGRGLSTTRSSARTPMRRDRVGIGGGDHPDAPPQVPGVNRPHRRELSASVRSCSLRTIESPSSTPIPGLASSWSASAPTAS